MKIFFHSSIFAKEQYEKAYLLIVKICKDNGYTVFADHMLKRDYHDTDKYTREQHQQDFQRLTKQIKECDVVIVEGTAPSIGTGHYMTIALGYLKPVLVLHQNEPHGVLVGDPNRLLSLRRYSMNDKKGLEKTIKDFLRNAEKKTLKNRFNLMLDDEMIDFLERYSKQDKASKADVIRRLILERMNK